MVVSSIISTVTSLTLKAVFEHLLGRFRQQVRVQRIRQPKGKYFNEFKVLFELLIRYELREFPEDVELWLEEYEEENKGQEGTLQEYLLVAVQAGHVAGFLYFEYSTVSRYLYIDFLGANGLPVNNHHKITECLVEACCKTLGKQLAQCRLVIFEMDDERDPSLNEVQRREAKAKKRRFGSQVRNKLLKEAGAKVYELCTDYLQPPLHQERIIGLRQNLLIVPLHWEPIAEDLTISKEQYRDILDMLFFETYDTLSEEKYLGAGYHQTLTGLYEKLMFKAPERIKLKPWTLA